MQTRSVKRTCGNTFNYSTTVLIVSQEIQLTTYYRQRFVKHLADMTLYYCGFCN